MTAPAPPDPDQLLLDSRAGQAPASRGRGGARPSPADAEADYKLLEIMWKRLGWDPPIREITGITRNEGGRTEEDKRRPRVVPPNRKDALLYYSPTNTAKLPSNQWNLWMWKIRQALLGVAVDTGLQERIISAQHDDKAMNDLFYRAMNRAKADEGADRGTARHELSIKLDFGINPGLLSPVLHADLRAYREVTRGFEMVLGETIVVDDIHTMCGTLDRVCEYQGRYYIMDLKPPESGFGQDEHAIQFAIYSRCMAYNWNLAQHLMATDRGKLLTTNLRAELPQPLDQERAIVVHVPRGGTGRAYVAWVDIAAGWEGFEHTQWMRKWQKRDYREALITPFEPRCPPTIIDVGPWATLMSTVPVLPATPASGNGNGVHTAASGNGATSAASGDGSTAPSTAHRVFDAAPSAADEAPLEPPTPAATTPALDGLTVPEQIIQADTLDDLKAVYAAHAAAWDPAWTVIYKQQRDKVAPDAPRAPAATS